MALQVWLPLINDFHNQGLAENVQMTQYGTITANPNGGKIGSCYSVIRTADGETGSLAYHGFTLPTTGWSMCLWAKFTAFPSNSTNSYLMCLNTSSASNYHAVLGIYYKSATEAYFTFNLYAAGRIVSGIELNKWYHLCITYDGSKGYMYVDGVLRNTVTSPAIGSASANNLVINGRSNNAAGTEFTGRNCSFLMNDVRVYDHCLSTKEVKEIAKALTIHFKMDRDSQDPISQIIYDSSGYGNNGTSAYAQQTFSTNTPRNSTCNLRTSSKSYMYCRINGNADYNNGNNWMVQGAEEITISVWAYATDWSSQTSARLFSCTESGGFNTEKSANTGCLRFIMHVYTNSGLTSSAYLTANNAINLSALSTGWHLFTFVYTTSAIKTYIDGEIADTYTATSYGAHFNLTGSSLNLGAECNGITSATSPWFVGGLSDFRLYYTALSAGDIKELNDVAASIDHNGNFYSYEFIEDSANQELLAVGQTDYHTHRDGFWSQYNANGEWYFDTTGTSSGSEYIPISPNGKTYYFDITVSKDAGNQVYIGFERYDKDFTPRSNSACVYYVSNKTDAYDHKRFFGTAGIQTDGVNPTAYIRLRILNGWSSTTGTMTIHNMSLREVDTATGVTLQHIIKTGVMTTDEFREGYNQAKFMKNGFTEVNEIIEI